MKANDLMIDDWVYNKNIDKPIQVYPMMFSQMFRQKPDATTEDYNIFPILITPEILEKNGFVLDDEWYIYTGQGVNIDVAFRDDNKFVYDLSILTGSGSMDIHAKYVHELQHALRLCGITHEIIL